MKLFDKIRASIFGARTAGYEKAKIMAAGKDTEKRRRLAESAAPPEVLYFLAEDVEPGVRLATAANAGTPRQADAMLAHDPDPDIRCELAGKIARLAPSLDQEARAEIRELTLEILQDLARDQIPKVRQILSEALKDVAGAPPEIINRLARDAELMVAAPVLQFSPVLTDDDLVAVIGEGAASGQLAAISRRAGLAEDVSDAVAGTLDKSAIAALLSNDSAQIREETLDGIIEQAAGILEWHAPLVSRPQLPSGAAVRLAQFVADQLLNVLQNRKELDAAAINAVAAAVQRRLTEPHSSGSGLSGDGAAGIPIIESDPAHAGVLQQHQAGKLLAEHIYKALDKGDREFVASALAVRASIPLETVAAIIKNKSAKGLTALVWKAGLPVEMLTELQPRLAGISRTAMVFPKGGKDFPFTESDMNTHLEIFGAAS
ncbi:MAG: DUF2336 domain-containing protein [Rhodospirillaceae bacterium]|nr:DUF2336 domain-containing protein [Rhodospirillaceae bacterium]